MSLTQNVKKILRSFGIDIIKYHPNSHPLAKKMHFFNHLGINKVFDIGANTGQYALTLRRLGFKGEIVSFEPLSKAYKELEARSQKDPHWKVAPYGIGDHPHETLIHIAQNSESSSLLPMLDSHKNAAPESIYIGEEKIVVKTLDEVYPQYCSASDHTYLKVDTQGYEKKVLEGATETLKKIVGIQLEMSLIPLYEGELLIEEMISYMKTKGFTLSSLEHVYSHPKTAQTLQVDGIFLRNK